jgi:hypothetical protein
VNPCPNFFGEGSAMTRATFVIFWPKLSSFIDWCCYYTQVSYTGSCFGFLCWVLVNSKVPRAWTHSCSAPSPVDEILYSFYIMCWTHSHLKYSWNTARWTLSNNQSMVFYENLCHQIWSFVITLYWIHI